MRRGTRSPSGRGGRDERHNVLAAAGGSSRGGAAAGGAVASATPTPDDDKGGVGVDADAEARPLATATPTDDDKEGGGVDEEAEARLERAMNEWLAEHEANTTVMRVEPTAGGHPPTSPRAGRPSIEHTAGTRVTAASAPVPASPVILIGDSSTSSASPPASSRPVGGSPTTSASRWSSARMSEDSSGEEIVPVRRSRKRRLRRGSREVSPAVWEAGTGRNSAPVGGAACAEEDVVAGGADDYMEGLGEEDLLPRRGVDWSVVDSDDDDSGDGDGGSSSGAPGDVDKAQPPNPSSGCVRARRSGQLTLPLSRYSKNDGVFGEMRVPLRTRTTAMRSDALATLGDDPRTAPWVSLDGQADRSGCHAFPPGATRSEKRKWRKVMRLLKRAMPTILEEAARAAAEGAQHPQTVATDPAARKRAFNSRDDVHYDAVDTQDTPPPFDIHYRRHPKDFWRTIVYYYTGPDGDIPIRMAVAAVERAVYRLLEGHGMAALNNNTPSLSALPLVPIVRDTREWRKQRAALETCKEEHGDLRVAEHHGASRTRLHHVRLQRGLGDPAEEQWLTDQGFQWEADRASRAERSLHLRQWPVVKDMITWLENHNGDMPVRWQQPKRCDKRVQGAELKERMAGNRLRCRWELTIRSYGGVSLDHAQRINAAFLRGRGQEPGEASDSVGTGADGTAMSVAGGSVASGDPVAAGGSTA
ncbi:hypothetical protein I4F81_010621 [Pyropia yezoensis]|uniref:Uncharacterized protein n=1 Tax=Pyropia yezoensis TaxID=2788 RepID=A0ACC3CCX3_PYRYE|nr:hypothetical protein I4F81_010621 [Neopyropia yezoensis]